MGALEDDMDYGLRRSREANYNSHLILNPGDSWDKRSCTLCGKRGGVDLSFNVCTKKVDPIQAQSLMFNYFSKVNMHRCINAFYGQDKEHDCSDWTLNDWAVALGGEAGELMNNLKKVRRGDKEYAKPTPRMFKGGMAEPTDEMRVKLLKELADIITYADLMIGFLGGDTGTELVGKFNEVSRRVGYGNSERTKNEWER